MKSMTLVQRAETLSGRDFKRWLKEDLDREVNYTPPFTSRCRTCPVAQYLRSVFGEENVVAFNGSEASFARFEPFVYVELPLVFSLIALTADENRTIITARQFLRLLEREKIL